MKKREEIVTCEKKHSDIILHEEAIKWNNEEVLQSSYS